MALVWWCGILCAVFVYFLCVCMFLCGLFVWSVAVIVVKKPKRLDNSI